MTRSTRARAFAALAATLTAIGLVVLPTTAAHADIEEIELGFIPWDVVLSPDGASAFVANRGGNEVVEVDVASRAVIDTYSVLVPGNMVFSPDGSRLYVGSDVIPSRISIIDIATDAVTTPAALFGGSGTSSIAITPDGSTLLHASANDEVRVIDTAALTIEVTLVTGDNPTGLAITSDGAMAYVINNGDATFQTINLSVTPATLSAAFAGNTTSEAAITPTNSAVYTNYFAALNRINPGSPPTYTTEAVPLAGVGSTRDLVFDPAGSGDVIYVADNTNNVVVAVDLATNTVLESFAVGTGPFMMDHSRVGTTIAVANFADTSISLIELAEPSISGTAGAAYVGTAFSFVPTADGFPAPEFSLTGILPTGLTFDPATGSITGTPTQQGTFPVTVTAENFLDSAPLALSIVVQPASAAPAPAALPPTGEDAAATLIPAGVAVVAMLLGLTAVLRRRSALSS